MRLIPFKASHMETLLAAGADEMLFSRVTPEQIDYLEKTGEAFTILSDEDDGSETPLACGGVVKRWEGRGEAWAIIDQKSTHDFVAIFNGAREILNRSDLKRVEAYIACDYAPGHRWIKLLGFELECARLKKYRPDGSDCSLYARFN